MRQTDTIDLTEALKDCQDTWVALNHKLDKVIASGRTPAQALKKARQRNHANPYIFWAAKNFGGAVPTHV